MHPPRRIGTPGDKDGGELARNDERGWEIYRRSGSWNGALDVSRTRSVIFRL